MVHALLHDLAQVQAGALVLFTSREQMRQAVDALPSHLRTQVLVQNALPRASLLATHRERVQAGQVSIIFGMQSFGEGLDLPGDLCASLFITKLPFAPPDDPVGEARAEWLRSSGRNPFNDLVVPATAIRLAQWMGRAIRTEHDHAQVVCYDRRLLQTSYGQQLCKSSATLCHRKTFFIVIEGCMPALLLHGLKTPKINSCKRSTVVRFFYFFYEKSHALFALRHWGV